MPTNDLQLHKVDLNFSLDDLPSLSSAQLALVHFNINATELHRAHAELLFMQRRAQWLEDERERLRVEQEVRDRVKEEKVEEAKVETAPRLVKKKKVVEEITLNDTDDEEDLVVLSTRKDKGKGKEVVPAKKVKKGAKRKSEEVSSQPRPKAPSRTSSARSNSNDTTSAPPNPVPLPNRLAKLPSFKRTNRNSQPLLLPLSPPAAPVIPEESTKQRPAPTFVPNHSATLAHELPSFLREDATKDSQGRFAFRPPPPGPFFTPLPTTADEDPDGKAPSELVKQLTTIIFPNLDQTVTPRLLLLFLARNQPKLHPRPIAMRRSNTMILVAFKSSKDAQQCIEMSTGKKLPDIDEDARTLEPEEVLHWVEESQGPLYLPELEERAREKGEELDLVEWKWGELSDEVRRDWRKYEELPRARVMPRLDVPSDVFVSEEYEEEVEILTNPESLDEDDIKHIREKRQQLSKLKIDIYGERLKAWNEWYEDNPSSEDFTTRPPIPAYPSDAICQKRLDQAMERTLRVLEEASRGLRAKRLEEEAELCRRHLKRNIDLTRLLELDPRHTIGTASSRLINQLNTRPLAASHHQPITPPSPIDPRAPVNSPQLTAIEERLQARREVAAETLAKFGLSSNRFMSLHSSAAMKPGGNDHSQSQSNPFKST